MYDVFYTWCTWCTFYIVRDAEAEIVGVGSVAQLAKYADP